MPNFPPQRVVGSSQKPELGAAETWNISAMLFSIAEFGYECSKFAHVYSNNASSY